MGSIVMHQKLITRYSGHLPVPSSVLRKISGLLRDPDVSAAALANALKMEPALAGKVLRLANSAYIGLPRSVSSVHHAVVLLGMKRIHSMVMTTELLSTCKNSDTFPFSIDRFRRHAVTVAFIAEEIGRHLRRYIQMDENELFSGALLHDIGKLVAGLADPEYVRSTQQQSKAMAIPFYRAEKDDCLHTTLGNEVADAWGLPQELAACIRGHHTAACFPEYHRIVSIVHVADVMAHLIGYGLYADEVTPAIDDAALREVNLPVERLRVIAEEILGRQEQISSLLEILQ